MSASDLRKMYGDNYAKALDTYNRRKPPLGLTPRFIRDEQRMDEIQAAVMRYMDAGLRVPIDWITEYNELVTKEVR